SPVRETMRAAVLYGKEDVRVEAITRPTPGPGEVLLRVEVALTCGTDVKVYRRGYHAKMIAPPVPFGHEYAGVIVEVGVGVNGFAIGDRVVGANSAPCDECFFCAQNQQELCEDLQFTNGAYAEFILLPERLVRKNLYHILDGVSFEAAAMSEPLACVVKGLEETPPIPGGSAVVLGVGPIGLYFVRLLSMAGMTVTAVGRGWSRLDAAKAVGATNLFSSSEETDVVSKVRSLANDGRGPDLVIECVGSPATWEMAISMARKAGTVNLFGGCPKETFAQLDTGRVHYDELTLKGAFHHTPNTFREAFRLLCSGEVDATQFIQRHANLNEVPSLMRELSSGASVVKVAVHPMIQAANHE
ncbi:MAG: zinc-binding dehydrogenase, partial [Chthonomonadales bacterium]